VRVKVVGLKKREGLGSRMKIWMRRGMYGVVVRSVIKGKREGWRDRG
jgi:hypothetical protein